MPLLPRAPAQASLVVDLARIVGAQNVSTLDADRLAYGRDCWPRDVILLRSHQVTAAPDCIVWPESPEEVARVLRFAEQNRVPIVPYGAGSGVCGGARPTEGGIILDLKRLRAIRTLDEDNLRMEVEAGIIGERLERRLNAKGYTLGHFPSSIVCSTVGGWLAARSAGQMSTMYGKIEDMAYGVEMVTPGQVRRLMLGPRPPDGMNFNALVIGSEGVFGALTAAQLRIRPLPEARSFRAYQFSSVEQGVDAIRKILRTNVRPAVVRLYDALDTLVGRGHGSEDGLDDSVRSFDVLAERTQEWAEDLSQRFTSKRAREFSRRLRGALTRSTVKAVLGAPLLLNRASKLVSGDCLLVLGYEGQRALVASEVALGRDVCLASGAAELGPGPGEHWYKNRYNVSFKASKMYASGIFVDTMEVAATWDRLLPLYRAVKRAISRDALVMAHFSHAYREGCSIYFSFAGAATDPRDPSETLERYDRIWKNALIAVHEAGGTVSHHHGIGISKADAMAREHGPGGMRLLQSLKQAFDPAGILNPGKLGLTVERRAPARRRVSQVGHEHPGFPPEIASAVGEKNILVSGGRTTVRPPDESALSALLRVAGPRGISVFTDQTGFRPAQGSVRIDLGRLEGVSRISEHSLFVEVEGGVIVERLERMLNGHGLTLGRIHPRALLRTIGAGLSRRLLVRRGTALGDIGDLAFAVRGLLAGGAPIETRPAPRSATGPELDRALIGGQGRLGIITRATLRTAPLPVHRVNINYGFATLEAAAECARTILRRGVRPSAGRVLTLEGKGVMSLEIVAADDALLKAQLTVAAAVAKSLEGDAFDDKDLALGGRFDAVVEVASLWTRAIETHQQMRAAAQGEAWLDFLAPEGVAVVARVVDAESRKATVEAGAACGGRVLAGSRPQDNLDLDSFVSTVDDSRRGVPDPEASTPGPYRDVLQSLVLQLDPTGVFRPRS